VGLGGQTFFLHNLLEAMPLVRAFGKSVRPTGEKQTQMRKSRRRGRGASLIISEVSRERDDYLLVGSLVGNGAGRGKQFGVMGKGGGKCPQGKAVQKFAEERDGTLNQLW